MEKITVTVVVNIPRDQFTHVFTQAFETVSEMENGLTDLYNENWTLTSVDKQL